MTEVTQHGRRKHGAFLCDEASVLGSMLSADLGDVAFLLCIPAILPALLIDPAHIPATNPKGEDFFFLLPSTSCNDLFVKLMNSQLVFLECISTSHKQVILTRSPL